MKKAERVFRDILNLCCDPVNGEELKECRTNQSSIAKNIEKTPVEDKDMFVATFHSFVMTKG